MEGNDWCKVSAFAKRDVVEKLNSHEIVNNNGLRSTKGYFWPEQPIICPVDLREEYKKDRLTIRKEDAKDAVMNIAFVAGSYVIINILLPTAKRFVEEKAYTALSEKIDNWKNRKNQRAKSNETNDPEKEDTKEKDDNIIYINQQQTSA